MKNQFAPDNTLEVLKSAKNYRFALGVYSATEKNDGSKTRIGTSSGAFSLMGHVAHIEDTENECRFTFSFEDKHTVKVRQQGSCLTFGYAVDATGIYKKQVKKSLTYGRFKMINTPALATDTDHKKADQAQNVENLCHMTEQCN